MSAVVGGQREGDLSSDVTHQGGDGERINIFRKAGKWKSGCVDTYCRDADAGVVLSRFLFSDLEG